MFRFKNVNSLIWDGGVFLRLFPPPECARNPDAQAHIGGGAQRLCCTLALRVVLAVTCSRLSNIPT
ncbi:hypothetical protein LINPERHAP1_LOCUS42186, partial [Linum perenne]